MKVARKVRAPARAVWAPVRRVMLSEPRASLAGLPVAGLDDGHAQTIVFALRRAATTDEERAIAESWLCALQVAQHTFDRLLWELDDASANLSFWQSRVKRRSHALFVWLQQGPVEFARRLAWALRLLPRPQADWSDADAVDRRVLLFRLLQAALAEALARVQEAGGALLLTQGDASSRASGASASTRAGEATAPTAPPIHEDARARPPPTPSAPIAYGSTFARAAQQTEAACRTVVEALESLSLAGTGLELSAESEHADRPPARDGALGAALARLSGGPAARRRVLSQAQLARPGTGAEPRPLPSPRGREDDASWQSVYWELDGVGASPLGGEEASAREVRHILEHARLYPSLFGAARSAGVERLVPPGSHAREAAAAARVQAGRAARRGERFVPLARWLPMPSALAQDWVRASVVWGAGLYAGVFLVRHSALAGRDDLARWTRAALGALRAAWGEHVRAPLEAVRAELFATFRRRPSIVSLAEYEADRGALARMLEAFKQDLEAKGKAGAEGGGQATTGDSKAVGARAEPSFSTASQLGLESLDSDASSTPPSASAPLPASAPPPTSSSATEAALQQNLDLVMRNYEKELSRPLRNLLLGDLARCALIQVQKLKVDTESAMLEIDQVLKANELSISLVAAVPALGVLAFLGRALARMLTPRAPDPRREAGPARLALVEAARQLAHVDRLGRGEQGVAPGQSRKAAQGLYLHALALAHARAKALFSRHRGLFGRGGGEEWAQLHADLVDLAAPGAWEGKASDLRRVMRSYAVYQQF